MNSNQIRAKVSSASYIGGGDDDLEAIRKFTGTYYRTLGCIGAASIIVSIATSFWTDYLHFDFSFIFWFWLGRCLKVGNPTARKWAIAISLIFAVFLVLGMAIPGSKANFGGLQFESSHPAFYAILAFVFVVFTIPGVVLITNRGRAAFARVKEG